MTTQRGLRGASALALVALLGLAACTTKSTEATSAASVAISFDPAPHVGATTCTVKLSDDGGAPLAGADVSVRGDMNHAGMKPVLADLEEGEPGTYSAPFTFTMGGDWIVEVDGKLADGSPVKHSVDVRGVKRDESGS
ncbi:MAG: FixH family protein [Planctomycetota bacterium]